MNTNLKHKQNGQVLLITVLIMMSTFTLAIAIGGMVLYELRSMVNTNQSTKAIYAAESGIEWRLFTTNKGNALTPEMGNGTSYDCSSDCINCIRCTGTAGRVNRAMEVSY
ncbi:MAG TPA: pilus assembly PilX N-terminal domain-containing protein [Candidatus Paceibacterota bacterium]|nr:pilus assembly PilX N-terminal domain-containing protein [Candidatus Paceibacterota bacterium]